MRHKRQLGLGILLLCGAWAYADAAGEPIQVTIAAQPIATALNDFARQSGLQVVIGSEIAKGVTSTPVEGTFTADAALNRLLEKTGLRYEYLDERTVAVLSKDAPAKPTANAADVAPSLRLAQAEAASEPAAVEGAAKPAEPEAATGLELEEIVVTGTHIRGAAPVGSALKVYTREDIDRSGAATLDQFARQMTENLSNLDAVANAISSGGRARFSGTGANLFNSAAFNLRGIGPSATLTLIDGRRLVAAGFEGTITDISQIPLSAIDHVEVMADGASALYGSDAVAGVVNIITRKDFTGAETALRYASATSGGAIDRVASQLLGTAWDAGHAMINYEYNEQGGLDASQRDYIPDQGGRRILLPQSRRNSVTAFLQQQFGDKAALSADLLYSDRSSRTRNIVFTQETGSAADAKQTGAALTLDRDLSGDWRLSLTGNYSRMEQASNSETTSPGVLILDDITTDANVLGFDALATGSLGSWGGRTLKGAFGAGYRTEEFEAFSQTAVNFGGVPFPPNELSTPKSDRNVISVYGELLVPLAAQLDLSLAARFDDYSDFGSTTNPKLGLRWQALPGLALRASYGESFKAPLLNQLHQAIAPLTAFIFSGPGLANVILIDGSNDDLGAESSTSFTAGIDWQPASLPDFKLGLTYFDIDFDDRISRPPTSVGGLYDLQDPLLAPFATVPADPDVVADFFNDPDFIDATGFGPGAVEAIVDGRFHNIASVKESGVDLSAAYGMAAGPGRLGFSLAVSRILENDYQTTPDAQPVALLNGFGQLSKYRGQAGVQWTQGGLSAGATVRYVNSYESEIVTPAQPVDSWTTVDLNLSYRTGDARAVALLDDMTLGLTVTNIGNSRPPFVQIPDFGGILNVLPFDPVNASPVGRLISLAVTKGW